MSIKNTKPNKRFWFCPLYSFDSDKTNVILSNIAQIKRAPTKLITIIQGEEPKKPSFAVENPTDFNWVMLFPSAEDFSKTNEEKNIHGEFPFALWAMRSHILALRLHKKGLVTPGLLRYVEESGSKLSLLGTLEIALCKNGFKEQPIYSLAESDVSQVRDLLSTLYSCFGQSFPHPFRITFDRFNSAYHGEFEDRLIDQMIAFESLYLGNEQELKYKLALRTAFLLGGTTRKIRTTIFDTMQKAYKLRNNIVHGTGIKDSERDELRAIVPNTEEYLRQSICKFLLLLSQGHPLKKLREKLLDENILKHGALLA